MNKVYGRGYVYIYNDKQKDFYLQEGCQMIDSDTHILSKKPFWVFKFDDVQVAFGKWCDRKKQ